MIRATIIFFFFSFSSLLAQVEGVTEGQLQKDALFIEAMSKAIVEDYEDAIVKMKKFAAQESAEFAPFLYLAKWSWQSDNLVEGLNYINRAENLAPQNQAVLELKIQLLKENYQLEEAAQVAKKAWTLDSTSVDLALRPAQLLLEAANPEDAEAWLGQVFDNIPVRDLAKTEALTLHIDILLSLEAYEAAEEKSEQLLRLSPRHLPFLYRQAQIYQAKKDTVSEIEVLKKVSEFHPREWKANLRMIHLQSKGNVELYLSKIQTILDNTEISILDRVRLLTTELSGYSINMKSEREALFFAAETLYHQQPESKSVRSLFIEAGGYHGQWGEIIDPIEAIIEEKGAPVELEQILRYMHILLEANQYSIVVEWGEDLLLQYPNSGELLLNMAYGYVQMGEPEEAAYYVDEASRMIRGNRFLTHKAEIIERMIHRANNSLLNNSAWFDQSLSEIKFDEVSTLNLLFCLKHLPDMLSVEWLEYIVTKSGDEEFSYLLPLTQAWAYFHLKNIDQAQQIISDCWNTGCYTHPMSYKLKYEIALKSGNTEKAEAIKNELMNLGVNLEE